MSRDLLSTPLVKLTFTSIPQEFTVATRSLQNQFDGYSYTINWYLIDAAIRAAATNMGTDLYAAKCAELYIIAVYQTPSRAGESHPNKYSIDILLNRRTICAKKLFQLIAVAIPRNLIVARELVNDINQIDKCVIRLAMLSFYQQTAVNIFFDFIYYLIYNVNVRNTRDSNHHYYTCLV
jgi:hypothetical protein